VTFPVKIGIRVKIKIKVKGDGQGCPSHTSLGAAEEKQVPRRAWCPVRNDIAIAESGFPQRLKPGSFWETFFGTAEAVSFPVHIRIKIKIKINVKGDRQECPSHTVKTHTSQIPTSRKCVSSPKT
jgi:hypothetical protein